MSGGSRRYNRLRTGRSADKPFTDADRSATFMRKIDRVESWRCWNWTAAVSTSGYGRFWDGTRVVQAHRFSYELWVGPIPEGLTVDHLCMNALCMNPHHLEAVTHRENNLRGNSMAARYARREECSFGHPLSGENIYESFYERTGARVCRTCHNSRRKADADAG